MDDVYRLVHKSRIGLQSLEKDLEEVDDGIRYLSDVAEQLRSMSSSAQPDLPASKQSFQRQPQLNSPRAIPRSVTQAGSELLAMDGSSAHSTTSLASEA